MIDPPPPPPPLTAQAVLLVDDHDLLRLGLRSLLQSLAPGAYHTLQVLEASNLQQALSLYAAHGRNIKLVLLDLHLPDAHGITGLTRLLALHPEAHVVVLSGERDPAQMRRAVQAGARAYLDKSGDLQQVVGYILSLALPGIAQTFGTTDSTQPAAAQGNAAARVLRHASGAPVYLTERQTEILDYVLLGHANREIATLLALGEGTVKNHVSTLLLEFGVRSRAQLISLLR